MATPDDAPFRDAEAWLEARGVRREPLAVPLTPVTDASPAPDGPRPDERTPVSAREALRLAAEAPPSDDTPQQDAATTTREPDDLQDVVAEAVAYARRATASAPKSEARLRRAIERRGFSDVVVDLAMARALRERLVDDAAFAVALVAEGQRKGHGPSRLRQDLVKRGIADDVIDAAVAEAEQQDQHAAAFAVARRRAERLGGVEPETAYRRLVSYVVRRGYPEALARKVSRDALWTDREVQRTAER